MVADRAGAALRPRCRASARGDGRGLRGAPLPGLRGGPGRLARRRRHHAAERKQGRPPRSLTPSQVLASDHWTARNSWAVPSSTLNRARAALGRHRSSCTRRSSPTARPPGPPLSRWACAAVLLLCPCACAWSWRTDTTPSNRRWRSGSHHAAFVPRASASTTVRLVVGLWSDSEASAMRAGFVTDQRRRRRHLRPRLL
jgi:hypothetical protein